MKTVIEMAQEAGFETRRGWWVRDQVPEDIFAASVNITREIERFAALVRADERSIEREKFAVLCNELALEAARAGFPPAISSTLNILAGKIRARGSNT